MLSSPAVADLSVEHINTRYTAEATRNCCAADMMPFPINACGWLCLHLQTLDELRAGPKRPVRSALPLHLIGNIRYHTDCITSRSLDWLFELVGMFLNVV